MNSPTGLGISLLPSVGMAAIVAQAAAVAQKVAADPTGLGVLRLVTETVVGISILATVLLFLNDRRADRKDREASDRKRDAAMKQIADDFRGQVNEFRTDIKDIVDRFEADRDKLLDVAERAVRAIATHDATIKSIVQRQEKVEMVVYAVHATGRLPESTKKPKGELDADEPHARRDEG